MNAPLWLDPLLAALERNALLGRLFFASVEFAALALAMGLLIFALRVRQPRLRAVLWLVVLAKPLAGLAIGTPLPLLALHWAAAPAPVDLTTAAAPVRGEGVAFDLGAVEIVPPADDSLLAWLAWRPSVPELLIALWICGVVVSALRLGVGRLRLARIIRGAAPPPAGLAARVEAIAREMGTARAPRCRVTPVLESPALAGCWRPVILLPSWVGEGGDPARVEWSLRHELTHWRLRDPLAATVVDLVCILFFFHPAAWWAGRKWQEATELACDRALLRSAGDAADYAEQLAGMLLMIHARRRVRVAGGLFAGRTQIARRIASLARDPLGTPARLSAAGVTAVTVFTVLCLAVGCGIKTKAATEMSVNAGAVEKTPAVKESIALPTPKLQPINRIPPSPAGAAASVHAYDLDRIQIVPRDPAKPDAGVRVIMPALSSSPPKARKKDGTAAPATPQFEMTARKAARSADGKQIILEGDVYGSQGARNAMEFRADKVVMENRDGKPYTRLEGEASITQNYAGRRTTSTADVIVIDVDPQGKPKVSFMTAPGSKKIPRISTESPAGPAPDRGKAGEPPFNLMRADKLDFNPDGLTVLEKNVRIEGQGVKIQGDRVALDNKTKILQAEGGPVRLEVGAGVQAEGQRLTFYVEKRTILLDGKAAIVREENGKTTRTSADSIQIELPENGGKPKVSFLRLPPKSPTNATESPKVTLAVRARTLDEIFNIIREKTGVRIKALGQTGQKKMDLIVRDMPVENVLTRIAQADQYVWVQSPDGSYEMHDKESYRQRLARQVLTKSFQLRYIESNELLKFVQPVLTPDIGTTVTADARSNKLIVTDLPSKLALVDSIIREHDVPPSEKRK